MKLQLRHRGARTITEVAVLTVLSLLAVGPRAFGAQQAGTAPAKRNSYAQKIELIVKEIHSGRNDYDAIQKLSKELEALPVGQINALFSRSLKKHSDLADELNIGWAWILSNKGQCNVALKKAEAASDTDDAFWKETKAKVLQKCGKQGAPGAQ